MRVTHEQCANNFNDAQTTVLAISFTKCIECILLR